MISREYANDPGTKFASFTMIKNIRFSTTNELQWKIECLKLLQDDDFGEVKIPKFKVEYIDAFNMRITSEYIKGRYVNREELTIIKQYVVDRINDPDNEYSFADFTANNYICECVTKEIYNIDLDNYKKITIDERLDLFRKKHKKYEQYQIYYDLENN